MHADRANRHPGDIASVRVFSKAKKRPEGQAAQAESRNSEEIPASEVFLHRKNYTNTGQEFCIAYRVQPGRRYSLPFVIRSVNLHPKDCYNNSGVYESPG